MTELDAAKAIINGEAPSPFKLGDSLWLCSVRITGTGPAYRAGLDEHAFRPGSFYLTQGFLERCAGLPLVIRHPESMELDGSKRVVGSILKAFIRGDEVWGVARCNDGRLVEAMRDGMFSTSPAVVMARGVGGDRPDGSRYLVEGQPLLLDHLALVPVDEGGGVWDLEGAAGSGVEAGETDMTEETETEGERGQHHDQLEKLTDIVTQLAGRMDDFHKRLDDLSRHPRADDDDRKSKRRARKDDDSPDRADDDRARPDDAEDDGDADPTKARELAADDDRSSRHHRRDDDDAKEEERRADAQVQMNEPFQAILGEWAPAPVWGESVHSYKIKCLKRLQRYSDDYKKIDLYNLPPDAFDLADRKIRADATRIGRDPHAMQQFAPSSMLREIRTTDRAGRTISTFVGPVSECLAPFKLQTMRVKKINTNPDRY